MLKVGLTGGIGSGKTTVAKIFECLGIAVLNADDLSRQIMHQNQAVISAITNAFGNNAYLNGVLNRKYISEIVFSDPFMLSVLNAIVHPATIQAAIEWTCKQKSPYTIKEAALFFETGSAEGMDYIVGVTSPLSVRIQRVMDRDGISKAAVMARINQQIGDEVKMKLCDFVIQNNDQQILIPQVLNIHQKILGLVV
ncbi:MAG: dephospho-CoA kinase [Sphingobacteriia bacterium]|nr:MAG: dephospho-CoA kinase [Sphingobacteriia bacterium]